MASDAQETPRTADELRSLTFGFDEHPLEHFRGLSADEIQAHPGIGPKFRERIQEALAELDALTGESAPEPEPESESVKPPAPQAHGVHDAHGATPAAELEPVAPGTGGPVLVVVLVALLLALIGMAAWITQGKDGSAELQVQLTEAFQQVAQQQQTFGVLADEAVAQAGRQAAAVYAATRERDLGAALRQLDDLAASLATAEGALKAAAGAGGTAAHEPSHAAAGEGETAPDRQALLAAAVEAMSQARAALTMAQPQTQDGLEAACQRLEEAVRALRGDEVKE